MLDSSALDALALKLLLNVLSIQRQEPDLSLDDLLQRLGLPRGCAPVVEWTLSALRRAALAPPSIVVTSRRESWCPLGAPPGDLV